MFEGEARVAFVIRGVVQQTMRESGLDRLRLIGIPTAQSVLIEKWCGQPFVDDKEALSVSSLNKTELLLNGFTGFADITPLGDLYASEVSQLGGQGLLAGDAAEIASAAGGAAALDACLRKLLDERYGTDAAFAASPGLRSLVLQRLNRTRFGLRGVGIVPKIGPRTVGIDLFI